MTVLGSKVVYELTSEQIKEFAKEIIAQDRALGKYKTHENPITKQEAAEYLRISYRTFDEKVKEGIIPASLLHRIDGTILLYKDELEPYVKSK
jgi:excisionase family DNA binding protein